MIAVLLAGGISCTAHATASWIIAGGGVKPDRDVFVVDEQSMVKSDDVVGFTETLTTDQQLAYVRQLMRKGKPKSGETRIGPDREFEINADQVFEGVAKPEVISRLYHVNCTRSTIRTVHGLIGWRNKAAEIITGGEAAPPEGIGEMQVIKFVCDRGEDGRSRDPAQSPDRLGFMFVGDVGISPVDFVWKQLWRDGQRPPTTYRPSKEETQEIEQRFRDSMAGAASTAAEAMDSSNRRNSRVGRNFALENWVGRTEQEFAAIWGRPDRYEESGDGARTLYFRKGYVNRTSNGYGQVLREDAHWCDISVLVRNGVIKDYTTSGNSCDELIR
ncbi:hypothetical protein [Xanthomonas sp. WHRI 7945]|nr:hypothetical protein [Xanthomonas campestris pv. campestris]